MSLTDDIFAKRGTWQLFKEVGEFDLSSANIGHIDRVGRLWLRLPNELLCTDGRHVIKRYFDAVLTDRRVGFEGFTNDGKFWVLGSTSRLISLDLNDGRIKDYTDGLPPLDEVLWVRATGHHDILFIFKQKVLRFDGENVSELNFHEGELGNVRDATISPKGNVWLTADSGLYSFVGGQAKKHYLGLKPGEPIWDVTVGVDESVWVPGRGSIFHLEEGKCNRLSDNGIDMLQSFTSLLIDSENNFWLSLHFRGVMCVNSSDAVFFPFEDTPGLSWPKCIVQEHTGAFWFIGVGNGVLRYDPNTLNVIQHGYLEASALGEDGKLRVAAASRGLMEYDIEDEVVDLLSETIPSRCYGLMLSPKNDIYISSQQGLSIFDRDQQTLLASETVPGLEQLKDHTVHCTAWDYENCLWLSTQSCLYRWDQTELKAYTKDDLKLDSRVFLYTDSRKTVWFFSHIGSPIWTYNAEGFSQFPETLGDYFGPLESLVSCCCEDADGNIWLGSSNGRLVKCDPDKETITFERELDGGIRDVRIDKNGVRWVSTVNGLVIYNSDNLYNMTEESLLPSRRIVSTYERGTNDVLILTERGLCEYRPNRHTRPELFIAKVVTDKVYAYPKSTVVSNAGSIVSIYLSSINMKAGPLLYKARMVGHDDLLTETGREEFHYEDLPVGHYRFEVSALDQDLITSKDVAAIEIQIIPDLHEAQIAELESNLQHAEDFAANIFRSINDAIIILDDGGRISIANDAALNLLGYDMAELVGHPVATVLPEEHGGLFDKQGLAMLKKRGHFQARELELSRHNGDRIPVLLSASCMIDRTENFTGYVIAASDISEYKMLQSQVLHSQKMESLGMLASGVAHDFNNLLSVIVGNVDLVRMELDENTEHYACLSDSIAAGKQAGKLCSELLAYSGKQTKLQKPFDLSIIVKENAELLRSSVSRKIAIESNLADDLPSVLGDEVQIMQIVLNLVINAAEAIGDHPGKIHLSTKTKSIWGGGQAGDSSSEPLPPGMYVLLEISDSGCGMDENTRMKIFEPFFTTKATGHGLGLSAILGIVNSHGGTINVISTLGEGTTFQIYLPVMGGN